MRDRSLRIIYALKQSDKPWEEVITKFRAKETDDPGHIATQLELYDVIKEVFIDYVSTSDRPENVVRDLLHRIDNNGSLGMAYHMAMVLKLVQVRDGDMSTGIFHYVNGFRSLMEEEND